MSDREKCQAFANKHKVLFEDRGEVGFGRKCVGFTRGDCYVDYRPYDESNDYRPLAGFDDARVEPPAGVPDAYHKHDCLAVLVHGEDYDEGIRQLALWVDRLEAVGVEIVRFDKRPTSAIQALLTGVMGYAVRPTTIEAAAPAPPTKGAQP